MGLSVLLVALINFAGAFVQSAAGFGYALVSMGLMPYLLPVSNAAAICAVNGVVIGTQMVVTLRKHVNFRVVAIPLLFCFATINLGLKLLNTFDEMLLRSILAAFMILVTAVFAILKKRKISIPSKWYIGAAFGLVTGLATGMFSLIGPFLIVYYMNICQDTMELKACLELSFLAVCLYTTANHYFVYGTINADNAIYFLAAAIAAFLAGKAGLVLYRRINKEVISRIIYFFLPLMAIMLLISANR